MLAITERLKFTIASKCTRLDNVKIEITSAEAIAAVGLVLPWTTQKNLQALA